VRALVTGASGFLGRSVVPALAGRGHDVTALVRSAGVHAENGTRVLAGDLSLLEGQLASEIARHDAIVHLAAATSGTPRDRFDGTVLATERLLDALEQAGWRGRFVHVSTLAVYGFNELRPNALLDERAPLEPDLGRRDDYAWTKAWQERLVDRFARRTGAEVVIVRPGSVYGPGRAFQHRLGRLIGDRLLLMVGGRTPMPLTYVENVASLLATCVEHPRAAGEVFNAIDPLPPPQWRYLRELRRTRPEIVPIPVPLPLYRAIAGGYERLGRATHGAISPPGMFARYMMTPSVERFRYDTRKPARVLSWSPPVSRDEALRRTFGGTKNGRSAPPAERRAMAARSSDTCSRP
jgi:UDP-glucose 4-epimerase